jgi:alpha-tubulin suppressor-like RCC1 family protein
MMNHLTPSARRRQSGRRLATVAVLAVATIGAAVGAGAAPAGAAGASILEAWGYNAFGQLGNGTTTNAMTPGPVSLPPGVTVTAAAAGGEHSLAIGSDGKTYSWGQNGYGQLGNGTTTNSSTPVAVALPVGVHAVKIAAGLDDSVALGSDGKVYAWGDDSFLELGDGSGVAYSTTPVVVALPTGTVVTSISAGQFHNVALASTGVVYGWGYDGYGQLGDGRRTTPATPVVASMPTGVLGTAVAAGGYHTVVAGSDGNVYAYGYNNDGQLGLGTKTLHARPSAVLLPAGVSAVSVAAGLYHSVMVGSDGKVYAWGDNSYGQLGDGTLVTETAPVVSGLTATPTAISAGEYFTSALLPGGAIDSWGQNGFGQLGTGTTANATSPTPVHLPPNATFTGLASNSMSSHSLAIAVPSQATTTTTLSSSVAAPTYGQTVTVTANVVGSDGGGTVAFRDGAGVLAGCGAVVLTSTGSSFQATCSTGGLAVGSHPVTATYSGDGASGSSSTVALAVAVSPATLSVTASSGASTYGSDPGTVTAGYAGFVNGDGPGVLSTTPTCTTTATASSHVGSYPTHCSGATATNYTITYTDGMVVVGPAPLAMAASSGTVTYGSPPPAITPTFTGFVNGDTAASLITQPTCSTTADATSPVGTYSSTCVGAIDPDYAVTATAGQVVVGAAPLVVTASSSATTYGTAPAAVTPSYSGFLNGDTAASLITQPTCSTTADATSPVGTYPTTCAGAADANYAITYTGGTATVSPAPITVTASSASMTYGDPAPTVAASVDGLQNGEGAGVLGADLSCTTDASPTSAVGSYRASCTGGSDPNYAITYVDGTTTVTPAQLIVTASSASMTYGDPVPAVTDVVGGLRNGEDAGVLGADLSCASDASPTSAVGSYRASCTGGSDPNYAITYVDGTTTVTPAQLTVTASSASMTYGDSVPAVSPQASGLVGGETLDVLGAGLQCSTSAQSDSAVGTYPSVCSGAVDANYTITYVNGAVTVQPAALVVTASSAAVSYGGSVPPVTPSYVGFVNSESASALTTLPTCSTTADDSSPAGTYATACSGAVDPNYVISYEPGHVVIGQAPLVIVASSATMTYGDQPPAVTAAYHGLAPGDTPASLSTPPSCVTTATSSSGIGDYVTSCTGAADPNYTITYEPGHTYVAPAPLTVTASSASQAYGAAPPNVVPSYTGFVNGDDATSLTAAPACTSPVTATTGIGTYASTCSDAADPNYAIAYINGSFTVTPAEVTVTAGSVTSVYGAQPAPVIPTVDGLQNGEDPSVLGAGLSCTTPGDASSPVGAYPTSCAGADDPNYSVAYVTGTLTVTPAPAVVMASSDSFTYGSTPPVVTATVTGLVAGDTPAALGTGLTCSTAASATTHVGAYPSSCSGSSDANYSVSYVDGVVQEVAASLVVAASSGTMTYGAAPPSVSPSYSGFVNGDGPSVLSTGATCSTTATTSSPVGTYSTSCSGGSASDYSLSYVPGSVVVGASTLVVTASSDTRTYGSTPGAVTPTYAGFVNGDTEASLTTAPACGSAGQASSSVGSYATTCSGASDPNYVIDYVAGLDKVQPAPVTVTASSTTMTYGSGTPTVTPTVTGLQDGEQPSVLGAGLQCTTSAGPTSAVGSYATTCSGAADSNYSVTYAGGTVTVGPATLTVTSLNQTRSFGAANPVLTYSVAGFVDGQSMATSGVTGQPSCTTTATVTSPAGTYPITCAVGSLAAANYTFAFVAGTLTVTSTTTLACFTVGSVTVAAGQSVRVAPGCTVIGSITVKPGGAIDVEGALVLGSLMANGGTVRMCNSTFALLLNSTGATGAIVVGDGTSSCQGSTLVGGVSFTSDTGGVSLQGDRALGSVSVTHSSGGVNVSGNRVLGALTVSGNTGTVVDHPNTVVGRATLQ